MTQSLCRDCLTILAGPGRCPACRSPRTLTHPELETLAIAHLDCDAFYASVEKRDDPSLRDRPLIIGGGRRGVVSTACYIARLSGVKSAMPMFKALKLCPEAVVIRPRMSHYAEVSRQIRALMLELTPLVEPLSLDEAFLDLTGTSRLHNASPALTLARLQSRIEAEIGITTSIGLSHNKFLAKIASEQDKPRGFAVIGRAETRDFLASRPVSLIWGIGPSTAAHLESSGIRTIADLASRDRDHLVRTFGALGDRLWALARGEDARPVTPNRVPKSISHETTFAEDVSDPELLRAHLWALCEQVSARAKALSLAGSVVTLKLKRPDFRLLTRRQTLPEPTRMADSIFRVALPLLDRESPTDGFRLIGAGLSGLVAASADETGADFLDPTLENRLKAEQTTDRIRARFGPDAIMKGRALRL